MYIPLIDFAIVKRLQETTHDGEENSVLGFLYVDISVQLEPTG